jgi:hypothetical protein
LSIGEPDTATPYQVEIEVLDEQPSIAAGLLDMELGRIIKLVQKRQ